MKTLGRYFLITLLALGLLGAGDDSKRFERLGHNLMCTCGCNQILLECNHVGCPSSSKMRDELTAGLTDGKNNDVILQSFVEKYGPTVLAAPTTKGFDQVAWIMPFAIFSIGIGLVVFLSRKWKLRTLALPGGVTAVPPERSEELRARIRQETES